MIPLANQRTYAKKYLRFIDDDEQQQQRENSAARKRHYRHALCLRIARRTERTFKEMGLPFKGAMKVFISGYFIREKGSDNMKIEAYEKEKQKKSWHEFGSNEIFNSLEKSDVCEFLSWGFYNKTLDELCFDAKCEIDKMMDSFDKEFDVRFENKDDCKDSGLKSLNMKTCRQSLDDIKPIFRPLMVYIIINFFSFISAIVLRLFGFQYYTTKSGLSYWFREGINNESSKNNLPILFFHGIGKFGKP